MLEPDETGEMVLTALHPGKTVEQAKENTGWDLKVASELRTTKMVTEKELKSCAKNSTRMGFMYEV